MNRILQLAIIAVLAVMSMLLISHSTASRPGSKVKPLVVAAVAVTTPSKTTPKPLKSKETKPVEFTIETEKGTMKGILFTEDAPITTQNFIKLSESGFYNGLTFHRVEPGFVIQTGDPTATGAGGSKDHIPLEISPNLKHDAAGVLGMARTADPNSATSQFYITLNATPSLDGSYAVFGKLTSGVDVAQEIVRGDKMLKVSIKQPALALH